MSDLTDLQEIKSNIIARLKEITAKPKPSYDIEGQEVRWQEYFDSLTKRLKDLNELIALEDGPYEERTQGFT
jgi:hypothetical protein